MSDCKNPVCSCRNKQPNSIDPMVDLVITMVNLAINDGVIKRSSWIHRLGREGERAEDGTKLTLEDFREEARSFIRQAFEGKNMLRLIEQYWENPTCKDCGVHVSWPREYCLDCRSPKEREDERKRKYAAEKRRKLERQNAKLLR